MNPLNPNFSTEIDFTDITQQLTNASLQGRNTLFENEVYDLLDFTGAVLSPVRQFIPNKEDVTEQQLAHFKSDKVVLKIVSSVITHKTEAGGVKIVANQADEIRAAVSAMLKDVPAGFRQKFGRICKYDFPEAYKGLSGKQLRTAIKNDIQGVLIVEYIESETRDFGSELLVGLRNTREFGITISAGLGGTDTELFAENFYKGKAIVSASTELNDGQSFFKLFKVFIF